jgi:hypothetical protein
MKSTVKAGYVVLRKQQVGGAFNLHKLSPKGSEACRNDVFVQWNLKGSKPWQPMALKLADDVSNG